ncbi:hypothetical protein [Clostridium taeniosporum]|uniref:Uncharacterized protein n=1 Tax=Clostridium taeniosporum TaxID=394958 RepID=A0A1D7XJD3_9CLOT|nr:hypothetical protein [Clostridium taeniosporum]AOR23443.1 hypothetical protein BGI42_06690 [Clostridium taeniosporum]
MENKRKYILISIGICGVLFGRIFNRILSIYFGNNSSNVVFGVATAVVLCAILISIVMGYYKGAIQLIIISLPMIIGGIGLYRDNMDMVGFSLLIALIMYPILIKVMKKLNRNE